MGLEAGSGLWGGKGVFVLRALTEIADQRQALHSPLLVNSTHIPPIEANNEQEEGWRVRG